RKLANRILRSFAGFGAECKPQFVTRVTHERPLQPTVKSRATNSNGPTRFPAGERFRHLLCGKRWPAEDRIAFWPRMKSRCRRELAPIHGKGRCVRPWHSVCSL